MNNTQNMNNTESTNNTGIMYVSESMYRRYVVDICDIPDYGQYVEGVYEVPYNRRPTENKPFVGRIYINEPADVWEGTRLLFNT